MTKGPRDISARQQRVRHEGPTVFLLVKRRDLLGGEIKIGTGGVLRLTVSEAVAADALTYYHHLGLLSDSQFCAGSEYGDLHWKLFGKDFAQRGVFAKIVHDEATEDEAPVHTREAPIPVKCQTYCGQYCDCPAKNWMDGFARFGEADRHLQRFARNKDRIVMRKVTIDKAWPETQGEVARLISALEVLRRYWKMG